METRRWCSGLRVSRLGLSTMTWGRDTPAENAHALLEMFCEAGGTLIDTAAAYGAGDAERIVGKLVRELGNRDEVVIATKAGFVIRDGKRIVDTSRRALLRDLDGSLRRLQSDYIDLWQIHAWGEAPSRNRSTRSITRSRPAGCATRECRTSWAGKRHRPPPGNGRFRAARRSRVLRSSTRCWRAAPRSRCSQPYGPLAWASFRGHHLGEAC